MSAESGATRWWENYLVRYLMPSIAGVAIVSWLCSQAGDGLRALLFLPPGGQLLDARSLTLVFLYANLFCYVASYPVLLFHATRVIDFRGGRWLARRLSDGYILTIALAIAAFLGSILVPPKWRHWVALALVVLFVAVQLRRMYLAFSPRVRVDGLYGTVSPAYGLAYALARQRGIPEEIRTRDSPTRAADGSNGPTDIDENEEVRTRIRIKWRPEFIETYRHLREHGNSAFIFLLELALAALVSCVIAKPGRSAAQQLGAIAALFAVWAIPAVFVHLLGQHLERRFSRLDRRLGPVEP